MAVTIPAKIRLKVDVGKIEAKMANAIASRVRRQIKNGKGSEGDLPAPLDDILGEPLQRTGQMLKSIKRRNAKSDGATFVGPGGVRSDGKRNAAIFYILQAKDQRTLSAEPLGVTEKMETASVKAAEKEIAKQIKSGKFGLVSELKRIK